MTATPKRTPAPPALESIAFLLVEQFSLVALAAARQPLRLANQLSGRGLFRWHPLSLDGRPVRARNGMRVAPDGAGRGQEADVLILCGGDGSMRLDDPAHARLLREQAARGVQPERARLGQLDAGARRPVRRLPVHPPGNAAPTCTRIFRPCPSARRASPSTATAPPRLAAPQPWR